jgi:hypothetical protein
MSERPDRNRTRGSAKHNKHGAGRGVLGDEPDATTRKPTCTIVMGNPPYVKPVTPVDTQQHISDESHLSDGTFESLGSDNIQENISIASNLDQMNKNIKALSEQFADMKNEMVANQKTNDKRMSTMESTLSHLDTNISSKHDSLLEKLEAKFESYDKSLKTNKKANQRNNNEIEALKKTIQDQQVLIETIQTTILDNDAATKTELLDLLRLTNSVEAHQCRWAVRLFGLNAPDQGGENSDQAKYLTLDFIQDILCINGVNIEDVDCAHRVGAVIDGKQTMLVRFFSRDLAQHVVANKRNLKETPYVTPSTHHFY